jgi:hypothetical protein
MGFIAEGYTPSLFNGFLHSADAASTLVDTNLV